MRIMPWVCGCCTTDAINGLSGSKGPEEAMRDFCKAVYGTKSKYDYDGPKNFMPFYVFTAGNEDVYDGVGGWQKYGTTFAEFIKDNKLGKVVSPGRAHNMRHHPDTWCQTWVWMVDNKALKKWYTEMTAGVKLKRVRKPKVVLDE